AIAERADRLDVHLERGSRKRGEILTEELLQLLAASIDVSLVIDQFSFWQKLSGNGIGPGSVEILHQRILSRLQRCTFWAVLRGKAIRIGKRQTADAECQAQDPFPSRFHSRNSHHQ